MSPFGRHFLERIEFCPRGRVVCVPSAKGYTRDWRSYVEYTSRLLRMSSSTRGQR